MTRRGRWGVFLSKGARMKEKLRQAVWSTLVITVALVSACGGVKDGNAGNSSAVAVPTRQVTDDLGRSVTIPVKVSRIVSLAPNLTENIFAVGAGERLVGVTTFCNYPEQAKEIAKIGDTMTPNMETIVALKPDIVFVSTASQIEAFTKTLAENGIAVYVTNPTSLDGVMDDLKKLGDICGTSEQANQVAAELKRRIGDVWRKFELEERTRVFVQISKEPLFTIGKQSFLNGLLVKAGAQSVTSDVETAYPKLSKETASALNPEAIILSESDDNREPNEVFKNSPAVKSGRVFKVNADLLSRPGPRLVDALEQIAKDLHPGKFK